MLRVLIAGEESRQVRDLASTLGEMGFSFVLASDEEDAAREVAGQALDLVLVVVNGSPPGHLVQRLHQERNIPVIALLPRKALDNLDPSLDVDDFAVAPWDAAEIAARAKRALERASGRSRGDLIECGPLVIDQGRCEVSVGGRLISLAFREYELLRFLAGNPGKVFTRETLLNKVWSYDYFGGDRTVDVHIRRIRSKIEEGDYSFI